MTEHAGQGASPGLGQLTRDERRAYELGRRTYERGDEETALSAFRHLLETRAGFADVHYMVGTLCERRNDLAAAAESLREAVRLNPSYLEALLALAMIYERQGEYERSRELGDRARAQAGPAQGALDPTTRGKLANREAELGDAYRDAGELSDAIDAYRRALDRCPGFHDIRYRLGIALREAGLPARALAEFERVLRGVPGFLDAAVQLGLTLYSLGRTRDAVERWNEVLRADPGRSDARMYLRLVKVPERAVDGVTPGGRG